MNQRSSLLLGAAFALVGVCLGAFGAHALKPMLLHSGRLETYELAVRYQFYHAFALLFNGLLMHHVPSHYLRYCGVCFLLGILFFSGSLYTLSFTGIGIFGMITPIGGILLIIGWAFMFVGVAKK